MMKYKLLLTIVLFGISNNAFPQNPTGTLTDPRDGQVYKTVKIGEQWWMAEKLNYGIVNNDPLDNNVIEISENGLYQWDEMMQYQPSDSNIYGNTQGVCPSNWRIPNKFDIDNLLIYVREQGFSKLEGKALKSTYGWLISEGIDGNGIDAFGFCATPTRNNSAFRLWSSTKTWNIYIEWWQDQLSWYDLDNSNENAVDAEMSVRCVKDNELQTPNSWLGIYNTIPNNSTFPDRLSLWEDSTNININEPIKICADGSQATKFVFVNNNASINSNDIRFVVESNQTSEDLDRNGYFIDYDVSGNKITASFNHPQYVEGTYLPFRPDEIKIIDSNNPDIALFNIPVSIYRSPVVMIHGLWGKPSAFDELKLILEGNLYQDAEFLTQTDYEDSNDKSFNENVIFVNTSIDESLGKLQKRKFSCGKVDIIAHSMGGILARLYLQSEIYRNDIHKLITLNTPHSGTQIANYLLEIDNIKVAAIVSLIQDGSIGSFNNGAVRDLRYNSDPMLNDFIDIEMNHNLNRNIVPTHVIQTTGVGRPPKCNLLAVFLGVLGSNDISLINIFNESHDLIVPISSQNGGISTFSRFNKQCHLKVADNSEVQNTLIQLLIENPKNEEFFTIDGFHPPLLEYESSILKVKESNNNQFKSSFLDSEKLTSENSIEISYPPTGSNYQNNQKIDVLINSTGNINRIVFMPIFDCSDCSESALIDTFITSLNTKYSIPENIIGKQILMAVGFDSTNVIAFDTIIIDITPQASIDSIRTNTEKLTLFVGTRKSINVKGFFNDGVMRDVSNNVNTFFISEDSSIAKNVNSNFIEGIKKGRTVIHVMYKNDTSLLPIEVIQGDTIAFPPLLTAPSNINASDGIYTEKIEILWDKVGNASYYRVYRNIINDTIGAVLISDWQIEYNFEDTTIKPGEKYYYWIKTATSYYGSNETEFSLPDSGYAELECIDLLVPEEITGETNPYIDSVYSYEILPIGEAEDFDWYTSGGTVTGNDTIVSVTWTNLGIQTLSVKAINDCGEGDYTTLDVNVINYVTGIENNTTNSITVYPNPFKEEISIVLDNTDEIQNIEVYNTIGIKVKEVNNIHLTETSLNMENIEKGIYCLIISTEKGIYYKNIVKI